MNFETFTDLKLVGSELDKAGLIRPSPAGGSSGAMRLPVVSSKPVSA